MNETVRSSTLRDRPTTPMAARDSPLTQLLQAAPEDPAAADQLVARVYDELCRMAHGLRHDATTNHSIGLRCWLIISRNNAVALVALRRSSHARQIS